MATPIPVNHAPFTIEEVARATGGTVTRGAGIKGTGVTTDSRVEAVVFVALRGENQDAHAFADRARAKIVVVERGRAPKSEAGVVEVDDTLLAWGRLARFHFDRWKCPENRVIAITGSAGKTTTKELVRALAGPDAYATPGNLNNRIGVPSVVLGLEDSHRVAVIEMGMSLPGEIDALAQIAPPDVSIVTNVGVAHAEGVGGREGVMREKGGVYRALTPDGVAIVNADDDFATRAAMGTKGRVITFGRAESADYRLLARNPARIQTPTRAVVLALPIPGEVAAIDLCAALAAIESSGEALTEAELNARLATVRLEGRATLTRLAGNVLLLDDSYNANPSSMRAAFATLIEVGEGRRKVAVLGEMKELGPLAESEHAALDVVGVDLVIGCGGLIDLALDRAEAAGIRVIRAKNTEEAALLAAQHLRPGDAVLVKASRSVKAEEVSAAVSRASASFRP